MRSWKLWHKKTARFVCVSHFVVCVFFRVHLRSCWWVAYNHRHYTLFIFTIQSSRKTFFALFSFKLLFCRLIRVNFNGLCFHHFMYIYFCFTLGAIFRLSVHTVEVDERVRRSVFLTWPFSSEQYLFSFIIKTNNNARVAECRATATYSNFIAKKTYQIRFLHR